MTQVRSELFEWYAELIYVPSMLMSVIQLPSSSLDPNIVFISCSYPAVLHLSLEISLHMIKHLGVGVDTSRVVLVQD